MMIAKHKKILSLTITLDDDTTTTICVMLKKHERCDNVYEC